MDATGLITNPSFSFDNNLYWKGETPLFQTWNNAEFYETTFDIHQELTGLPNGSYLLKVKGFHRPGPNVDVYNDYQQGTNNASAQLYANGESVTLNNQAAFAQNEQIDGWCGIDVSSNGTTQYVPNNMHDAMTWFSKGYYENELPVTVTDGTLTLGIRLDENVGYGWVIFDDFRLEYLGPEKNQLYVDTTDGAVTICQGSNKKISLCLDNEDTLIAFQFYLRLPEGVSIALNNNNKYDAVLSEARSNQHTMTVDKMSDGSYKFVCYSLQDNAFIGNSGELLSINLVCDEDLSAGTYQGMFFNITFAGENENRITPSDFSFDIKVTDVVMGDVNNDGRIDVMDIVAMVKHMMEKTPVSFVFAAADIDGSGKVDIIDLVKEVRLVMSQRANAPSTSFDLLSGSLSLITEKDGAVTLNINDDASFVASQFLVTLSHGQRLADVTTDKCHTVSFEPVSDRQYVVVSYSSTNECYVSNTAALTLHVEGSGHVNVENATFVSDSDEKVSFSNANSGYTDGIRYAAYDFHQSADIYSTSGVLLRKNATSTDGLKSGVYIINGNKYLKK